MRQGSSVLYGTATDRHPMKINYPLLSQGRDREGEVPILASGQEITHSEPGQAHSQVVFLLSLILR
jgi:hypothetical protein